MKSNYESVIEGSNQGVDLRYINSINIVKDKYFVQKNELKPENY